MFMSLDARDTDIYLRSLNMILPSLAHLWSTHFNSMLTSAMHFVSAQTNRDASFPSTHRKWMSAGVLNPLWIDFYHLELQTKPRGAENARQHWGTHPFLSCVTSVRDAEHCLTFPCPSLLMCKICMIKWRCLEINWYWWSPENLSEKGFKNV